MRAVIRTPAECTNVRPFLTKEPSLPVSGFYERKVGTPAERRERYLHILLSDIQNLKRQDGDRLFAGVCGLTARYDAKQRHLFLSYYNAPSLDTWRDARALLVDPDTTAWQVWINSDPLAPHSDALDEKNSPAFPDPDVFLSYLKSHQSAKIREIKQRILAGLGR